jgi:hypothetical protein
MNAHAVRPRIMPGDSVIVSATFWTPEKPIAGRCVGLSQSGIYFATERAWTRYASGENDTLRSLCVPWSALDYAAMGYDTE